LREGVRRIFSEVHLRKNCATAGEGHSTEKTTGDAWRAFKAGIFTDSGIDSDVTGPIMISYGGPEGNFRPLIRESPFRSNHLIDPNIRNHLGSMRYTAS